MSTCFVSSGWRVSFTGSWLRVCRARFRGTFLRTRLDACWRKRGIGIGGRPFPPYVMLWAFVCQVLDPDKSCRKALNRIQAHLLQLDQKSVSTDTSAYCKARLRLPEGLFSKLCRSLGNQLSMSTRPEDLYHGRRVLVTDGSTFSMPDTPANQTAYPQPCGQAQGCGFPIAGFVGVFCLATGALLDLALGRHTAHDLNLFYYLRNVFQAGDIMLADRGFCSYAEIALMAMRGVDSVMRLHQARATDFRRGRVVGLRDHIVKWSKPGQCSRGLRKADYQRLPPELLMRELRYSIETTGFRTRNITLATTLLDTDTYSAEELSELYFRRWDVELFFAHIKTTMKMDVLRCKTPAMIRKELWAHLLAYNLVRTVMWEAATEHNAPPDRVSFKGAIQTLEANREFLSTCKPSAQDRCLSSSLALIAKQLVPLRPNRIEPRVQKRRKKQYPLMTKPRAQLKVALRA